VSERETGLIAWFARNSVAANLLMLFIIIGGIFMSMTIRKQMFPLTETNWIEISVPYPGAAPQEVEQGITIKIEEALNSVEGLKRVISYSNRSYSSAWVEVNVDYDTQEVLDEVKLQIDSISSFPDGMERPIVRREKPRQEVMYISLYGDLPQARLKDLGKTIHDEIRDLGIVNISNYIGGLDYEISIEVNQHKLREYQLSFSELATAIRANAANMSAGQIRAENGMISMRVENQAYDKQAFESIPVVQRSDGTIVYLGDVANVIDGFVEGLQYSKFNGQNSVTIFVGASSDQSIPAISERVKEYIAQKNLELPPQVRLEPWVDMTFYLQGRLDMMMDNMLSGGVLVFLILALFLRIRLAFWVMMGLPVSFLGALLFMPLESINVTINVISLFAFILVLGVVVDDAIVVGESASDEIEKHGHSLDNVVRGVKRVATPATFGVLTTIAAFVPMLLSSGPESAMSHAIAYVVVLCLLFSLVESKLILPAHLASMNYKKANENSFLAKVRGAIDGGLKRFIKNSYLPFIERAIHYRVTVLCVFTGILLIGVGLFTSGTVRFIGAAQIPHDFPSINIEMKQQSSEQATLDAMLEVQKVLRAEDSKLEQEFGSGVIDQMFSELESRSRAKIMIKMTDPELRELNTFEVAARWREAIPTIAGLKSLTISDNLFGGGRDDGDISFKLIGVDDKELLAATAALKQKLGKITGVSDVNDSRQSATQEVQFELKPLARSLGLTLRDIASQVNFSFYGLEAQRIMRDAQEVKVMLRYPLAQRSSIGHIDDTLIFTSEGQAVPLSELAKIKLTDGVNRIRREDGKRTINVWAAVDSAIVEPIKVAQEIRDDFMPNMLKDYPTVDSEVSGRIQEEMDEVIKQFRNFILALLVIYTLLAIPLRSYLQPFIILSVVPFGVIGSILGHMIIGIDLSAMSLFGIIAASGVVVNDSLVMVDFVNKARAQGMSLKKAVIASGGRRFRAIILTSLTTFVGLVPIMFESSMQAQIVIPMAVALAFGVGFATVITLILVPCLYILFEDVKRGMNRAKEVLKRGARRLA